MREIFKNWFFSAFSTEIYFITALPDFVPPSLKEKGDRGKGSIARNLPTIATRILDFKKLQIVLDRTVGLAYDRKERISVHSALKCCGLRNHSDYGLWRRMTVRLWSQTM